MVLLFYPLLVDEFQLCNDCASLELALLVEVVDVSDDEVVRTVDRYRISTLYELSDVRVMIDQNR
jgi:hypothetical protein